MYYKELLEDIKEGEWVATFNAFGGFISLQIEQATVDDDNVLHLVMSNNNKVVVRQCDRVGYNVWYQSYTVTSTNNRKLWLRKL